MPVCLQRGGTSEAKIKKKRKNDLIRIQENFRWLPNSEIKNIDLPAFFIFEDHEFLEYFPESANASALYDISSQSVIIPNRSIDASESELAADIAHEYRHHYQWITGLYPITSPIIPSGPLTIDEKLFYYFTTSPCELDAKLFDYKHVRSWSSEYIVRKLLGLTI